MALAGFTRFEAIVPDILGEYDTDVEPAALSIDANWFPAVENRGEGIFIELDPAAIGQWVKRETVQDRIRSLMTGHDEWTEDRKSKREFPVWSVRPPAHVLPPAAPVSLAPLRLPGQLHP